MGISVLRGRAIGAFANCTVKSVEYRIQTGRDQTLAAGRSLITFPTYGSYTKKNTFLHELNMKQLERCIRSLGYVINSPVGVIFGKSETFKVPFALDYQNAVKH